MNMNATAQMVTVSQGGTPRETELPTEIHVKIDPSLLPKPATGEWTEQNLRDNCEMLGFYETAKVINAALAAERENTAHAISGGHAITERLRVAVKELAAEREKVQTLVDALTLISKSELAARYLQAEAADA